MLLRTTKNAKKNASVKPQPMILQKPSMILRQHKLAITVITVTSDNQLAFTNCVNG